jgi:hypothetical protein
VFKLTHSKGKINKGLAVGAIIGAAVPIIATAATGGLAAVPMALWVGLGGALSGLFAGNVEVKSAAERLIDAEIGKAGRDAD